MTRKQGLRKGLFIFLLCTGLAGSSFAQQNAANWFSLKAFLPEWKGCPIELKIDGQTIHADTIRQDMYSLVDTITGIHEAMIQLKRNGLLVTVPLFIEPGTIRINDKGYNQLVVSGSPTNEAYQNLLNHITASAQIRYGYDYDKVNECKKNLCMDFIRQHRSSVLSLHLLKYYPFLRQPDDSLYTSLYQSLEPFLKESLLGRQMAPVLNMDDKIAFEKIIAHLQLPDTLQQSTRLYRAKYTLLDFWASWCAPCRQQNVALVSLFNTFRTKGFTIVSISLDQKKSLWLNAIQQDKLAWQQVSDLKGWESDVVKAFRISAVPANFLVDEKGAIIAKNIPPATLNSLLMQMLK